MKLGRKVERLTQADKLFQGDIFIFQQIQSDMDKLNIDEQAEIRIHTKITGKIQQTQKMEQRPSLPNEPSYHSGTHNNKKEERTSVP
jgi:hypothetical protein